MKKETSGKVVFSIYTVFLGIISYLAWDKDMGYVFLATSVSAFITIIGTILQFIPVEKKVHSGYAMVGVTSLFLSFFSLFRFIVPVDRSLAIGLLVGSVLVLFHCFNSLMPKVS